MSIILFENIFELLGVIILFFFSTMTIFGFLGFVSEKGIISEERTLYGMTFRDLCGPSNFNFLILFWIGLLVVMYYELSVINLIFLSPAAYILNGKVKGRAFVNYLMFKGYYGDGLLAAILHAKMPYTIGLFATIFWFLILCVLVVVVNDYIF